MRDPWHYWSRRGFVSGILSPLSGLYCLVVAFRRRLYALGLRHVHWLPVPVVVVGNVTVGGTGKTPFVAWLSQHLRAAGFRPGIVLRGYRGRNKQVLLVTPATGAEVAGDEAVLLARRAEAIVVVAPDRVAAARALVEAGCDIVIADDGLQHYRLGRNLEIAVLDGARRFGNGYCLPSGPLRERRRRWDMVDFRITQGTAAAGEWGMSLEGRTACAVGGGERIPVTALRRVHAVAGIGNPGRFFAYLERLGLQVVAHAFPDHHTYRADDLVFDTTDPVVMTEKDAVKCEIFARPGLWYLPVNAVVDEDLARRIVTRLKSKES